MVNKPLKVLKIAIAIVCTFIAFAFFCMPIVFQSLLINETSSILPDESPKAVNHSVNCSRDFFMIVENGSYACVPNCYKWTQYPDTYAVWRNIVDGFSSAFGIVISLIVFIVAIYKRKILFKFPTVFIIYINLLYTIRNTLYYISAIGSPDLFCSSKNLFAAVNESTAFCHISGALDQYISLLVSYMWLCYISITFHKLIRPFQARSWNISGRYKYIHVSILIIGITASFLPVLITVLVAMFDGSIQYAYIINTLPPSICVPNTTDVDFFCGQFIIIIYTFIYAVLLISIVYIIHKHKVNSKNNHHTSPSQFTVIEKKLIFLFIINISIGSLIFVNSAMNNGLKNAFVESLTVYFECEAIGHTGYDGCDRTEFEAYSFASYSMLYHVILGLLPIGPLIYVINWKCGKSAKNIHSASNGEVIENKAFNFNST